MVMLDNSVLLCLAVQQQGCELVFRNSEAGADKFMLVLLV